MDITLSEAAMDRILTKGGQVAVDFVQPVGCGKVSEVSVSTNLKGRNTSSYQKVDQDGLTVFLAKDLVKYINNIELVLKKGLIGSKLIVRAGQVYESDCKV